MARGQLDQFHGRAGGAQNAVGQRGGVWLGGVFGAPGCSVNEATAAMRIGDEECCNDCTVEERILKLMCGSYGVAPYARTSYVDKCYDWTDGRHDTNKVMISGE